MPISKPDENLLTRVYDTTAEVTSNAYMPHPAATHTALYLKATTAGTMDVDILMSDGVWVEEVANQAVVANDLVVVAILVRPRQTRVRFIPTAAPGTVVIDATYAGYSQPA